MLSDPEEDAKEAPVGSIKLVKPFTLDELELELAIDQATKLVP